MSFNMTEKNANNSLWGFGDTGETIKYEPVTELWVFTDQTPHKEAWLGQHIVDNPEMSIQSPTEQV